MSSNQVERNGPTVGTNSSLALFTDLYELTMLQAYFEEGMNAGSVFSLFVRRLPSARKFLLACGLASVLEYLENLRFREDDLAYLASLPQFSSRFVEWLREFRFTGDVYAVPEGTPVFANEPILEVVAPIPEAQLVETFLINQIQLQTALASKAARTVIAAKGRTVVDFAARRMHGVDAAVAGARAFYIAGVEGTSNVLAGKQYGIPVSGTMAHSYIQAHEHEEDAFRAFVRVYPGTILLVDTYDTLAGVAKVIRLAESMGSEFNVRALRLDSGDLGSLAREARRMLDGAGLQGVQLFASGGLNEYEIDALVSSGAPIDGFGVGTDMGVSSDAPALDIVYKLTEYDGRGRVKLSKDKPVLPGKKQIFRVTGETTYEHDILARSEECLAGRGLLAPVMRSGRRLPETKPALHDIRAYVRDEISKLPDYLRSLEPGGPGYPVEVSSSLVSLADEVKKKIAL